jgi:hypothetical protein
MLSIQQWFQNWPTSEEFHLTWFPGGSAIIVSITYSMRRAIHCSDPKLSAVSKFGEHQFELKSLSESNGQMTQITLKRLLSSSGKVNRSNGNIKASALTKQRLCDLTGWPSLVLFLHCSYQAMSVSNFFTTTEQIQLGMQQSSSQACKIIPITR